jgi:hypothetical protein
MQLGLLASWPIVGAIDLCNLSLTGGVRMKHYRVNKLSSPNGRVIKRKDILASSDAQAVRHAADSDDCPICDVLRDGEKVGSIL